MQATGAYPRGVTRILAALSVLALVAAGCGSSSSGGGGSPSSTPSSSGAGAGTTIAMKNIKFSPAATTVKVGQKVTWKNEDQVDHNVTAKAGASFKSQNFGSGGSYSFTPKKAGTIKYVCTIHPGMDGTLKVTK